MNRIGRSLGKFIDWVGLATGIIAMASMVVLMAVVNIEAISRRVFNSPTNWAFDVSNFLFLLSVVLALAFTTQQGGHIKIDMFISYLPEKWQRRLDVFADLLTLIMSMVMAWLCCGLFARAYTAGYSTQGGIRIPLYLPLVFMPLGFALWGLQTAVRLFRILFR